MNRLEVTVLSNSSEGIDCCSLMVRVDNDVILFNTPEGAIRTLHEQRLKLTSIIGIFFSEINWNHTGSFPDVFLTISDLITNKKQNQALDSQANKKGNHKPQQKPEEQKLLIAGPAPLFRHLLSLTNFIYRPKYEFSVRQFSELERGEKQVSKCKEKIDIKSAYIHPIVLTCESSQFQYHYYEEKSLEDDHSEFLNNIDNNDIKYGWMENRFEENYCYRNDYLKFDYRTPAFYKYIHTHRSCKNDEDHQSLRSSSNGHAELLERQRNVVCYAIETKLIPGKFDSAKAISLGVPKGPALGQIQHKNQPYQLPDGKFVNPEDCYTDPTPGTIILIISCPNHQFLDHLLNNQCIRHYASHSSHPSSCDLSSGISEKYAPILKYVYHSATLDVVADEKYQKFLGLFDSSVKHVFLHSSFTPKSSTITFTKSNTTVSSQFFKNKKRVNDEISESKPKTNNNNNKAKLKNKNKNSSSSSSQSDNRDNNNNNNSKESEKELNIEQPKDISIDVTINTGDYGHYSPYSNLFQSTVNRFIPQLKLLPNALLPRSSNINHPEKGQNNGSLLRSVEIYLKESNRTCYRAEVGISFQHLPTFSVDASFISTILAYYFHFHKSEILSQSSPPIQEEDLYLPQLGESYFLLPTVNTCTPSCEHMLTSPPHPSTIEDESIAMNGDSAPNHEDKVVVLGTSASVPTGSRGVTSIYVESKGNGIILDAGTSTYNQLVRKFGVEKTPNVLSNLRCIFISHKHADHIIGLFQLLVEYVKVMKKQKKSPPPNFFSSNQLKCCECEARFEYSSSLNIHQFMHTMIRIRNEEKASEYSREVPIFPSMSESCNELNHKSISLEKLIVVGPMWLELMINDYYHLVADEDFDVQYFHFINAQDLSLNPRHPLSHFFHHHLNVDLQTVMVIHSFPSYAVSLSSPSLHNHNPETPRDENEDWKLVYSGDTRPSGYLLQLSKDATLLIHECTFDDKFMKKALHDNHCTTSDALSVAYIIKPEVLLFTHFSSRFEVGSFPDIYSSINADQFASDFKLLVESNKLEDYISGEQQFVSGDVSSLSKLKEIVRNTVMAYDFLEMPLSPSRMRDSCPSESIWLQLLSHLLSSLELND